MPPILPGEKFACLAFRFFSLEGPLPGEIDLGQGCWALSGPPIPLDAHWRTLLGELESEEIETSTLVLFVKTRSAAPVVNDAERVTLENRVQYLHWGIILAAGIPESSQGLVFWGGNDGAGPRVRGVSHEQIIYRSFGRNPALVSLDHICRAGDFAPRLEMVLAEMKADLRYTRLMRGFGAFVSALRARQADVRLHQFVRAVEAVTPEGRYRADGFVDHLQDFLPKQPESRPLLHQLHRLRSIAEHHGDIERLFGQVPRAEAGNTANRRARQAEELARQIYCRLLINNDGYLWFLRHDDSARRFWAQPPWVRRALWGAVIDLEAVG